MDFARTALTALLSIVALFAITKLIGYRQLAQLSAFDYINGITIGSIGAELSIAEGKIKQNSTRYAKRQLTWFRRNKEINWLYVDASGGFDAVIRDAFELVSEFIDI